VRIALILQVVGPWLGVKLFMPTKLGYWFIIYPIYKHILPIIGYFWEGDHAAENGVWNWAARNSMRCATISQ